MKVGAFCHHHNRDHYQHLRENVNEYHFPHKYCTCAGYRMTYPISIYVYCTIRDIQLHYINQGVPHRDARYLAHKVCAPNKLLRSIPARASRIKKHAHHIYTKYGLTYKQFEEMMQAQQHRCSICTTPITTNPTPFSWQRRCVVDHCHTTGRVRGLLCNQCNTAIGLLKEDPSALTRAVEYLSR